MAISVARLGRKPDIMARRIVLWNNVLFRISVNFGIISKIPGEWRQTLGGHSACQEKSAKPNGPDWIANHGSQAAYCGQRVILSTQNNACYYNNIACPGQDA